MAEPYTARRAPDEYDSIFLSEELRRIEAMLAYLEVSAVRLVASNAAPFRAFEGDIYHADGTNWNPGGTGQGLYAYIGGAWVKL